jgi:hypothetical protein
MSHVQSKMNELPVTPVPLEGDIKQRGKSQNVVRRLLRFGDAQMPFRGTIAILLLLYLTAVRVLGALVQQALKKHGIQSHSFVSSLEPEVVGVNASRLASEITAEQRTQK